MDSLTGKQKRRLKSLAHHLKPVVYVGKNGMTESLVAAVDKALADHELVKIRFVDFKDEKPDLMERICAATGADIIGLIGNNAILFRRNRDAAKQKIVL
ncbi:MAG: hypothetical protein A2176_08240 [Spirochaetes bacterium RBG_13_51_14]|nr:MAG: hypothetical protein A2176_08240 [Spirochaetes bacterium RBG_13_51_14]